MVAFGERLKLARNAKRLSQQALAELIGKSLNTVGLYERGLRQPSLETLCLLSDILTVSVDYLLARTSDRYGMCGEHDKDEAAKNIESRLRRIEEKLGLV